MKLCVTLFKIGVLCLGLNTFVFAQQRDSTLKLDTIPLSQVDTAMIKKDTIPVFQMRSIDVSKYELPMDKSPVPKVISTPKLSLLKLTPTIIDSKINYWQTKTAIGVNLNQSSFSGNWKAGGVNSVALGGLVNYKAEYNKGNFDFLHETNLQYGKVKNKDQLERKTVDRIFLNNKLSFQISKNWSFFSSLTFESQFDNGYNYVTKNGEETPILISKFMSPGYLTESLGVEYKPNKFFSLQFGTGTARQTFVLDTTMYKTNPSNYGVEKGKSFRNDMAFQLTANYDKEIFKNVGLKWRYWMFIPYQIKGLVDVKHRLDATLTMKVNRFMNVNLNGTILYDKDMDLKVQTSQALAVGVMIILPR